MPLPTKITLDESELPRRWYNLLADLPAPAPPVLHPGTLQPVEPEQLAPLLPKALIIQELTRARYVDIPAEVLDVYRLWRPSPLYRARRLETALDTPAKIFYKYEGGSPAGSHRANTAVPQAYYNAAAGNRRLTTESGAGRWGAALAFACAQFGLRCEVWQAREVARRHPDYATLIRSFGGVLHPSPSGRTAAGRAVLDRDPRNPGSPGVAVSEALEVALRDEVTSYALGSTLNHVLLHQTVIGEEAMKQLAKVNLRPDLVIGCAGGGASFAGLAFPFLREKLAGTLEVTVRAVELASCPTAAAASLVSRGLRRVESRNGGGPAALPAGSVPVPLLGRLRELGLIEVVSKSERESFEAGVTFARTEGILSAPDPMHALAACIDEALRCRESGEQKVILTALSGQGQLDLAAYDNYLADRLQGRGLSADEIKASLAALPRVPAHT